MVASNPEDKAQEVTKKAFASYAANADVKATVTIISELKGIGPATASLILAVHDPENVMFFSDEAYHWLCAPDSEAAPDLKYNAKEYEELYAKTKALIARLKVSPIDIEKVAYVLKRENQPDSATKKSAGRPRGQPSLSDESKNTVIITGRPRGRPKVAPKSEMPEDAPEEPKELAASSGRPRGRPKSVPKPEASESIEAENLAAREASPINSRPTAGRSKRKADAEVLVVDMPAPKRGRPKGKR